MARDSCDIPEKASWIARAREIQREGKRKRERAEVAPRAIESIAKVFDLLDLSTC
jgi:hypothetical protein